MLDELVTPSNKAYSNFILRCGFDDEFSGIIFQYAVWCLDLEMTRIHTQNL